MNGYRPLSRGRTGRPGLSGVSFFRPDANRGRPTFCGESRRWLSSFGANGGISRTVPLIPPFQLGPRVATPRRAQQLPSLIATALDDTGPFHLEQARWSAATEGAVERSRERVLCHADTRCSPQAAWVALPPRAGRLST